MGFKHWMIHCQSFEVWQTSYVNCLAQCPIELFFFSLNHEIVFKRNIFNVCFLCMEWPLDHTKQVRILSMHLYAFPYCRKIVVDVHYNNICDVLSRTNQW